MAFKMTSPFHAIGDPKKSASQEGSAGRDADDLARKNKTGIYAPTKRPRAGKTLNEMGKVKLESKGVQTGDYGKGTKNKKGVVKGLDVKAPEISTKKPTVKPKDNSRKAIRQRKKADKAAGVSKSQMRANKAKSKSEAFMAKAKASKDPSMRAQLKRKSDRLAKRAARKGGSPAKAVGDPKDPKKKYGKVTVKKEKKGNTTTVTATRPYSTTAGKKTYKQFEKEGGNVAAAKKFNKGSDTKSITVVDKKQIGAKKLSTTPKSKISSAKPSIKKYTPREKNKITQTLRKREALDTREEKQTAFDKAHGSTASQRRKSHNPQKKKKNLFKVKSNLRKRVSRKSNFKQSCN